MSTDEKRATFQVALARFAKAASDLNAHWDNETAHTVNGLAFYPFNKSFNEVVSDIIDWRDAIREVNKQRET